MNKLEQFKRLQQPVQIMQQLYTGAQTSDLATEKQLDISQLTQNLHIMPNMLLNVPRTSVSHTVFLLIFFRNLTMIKKIMQVSG